MDRTDPSPPEPDPGRSGADDTATRSRTPAAAVQLAWRWLRRMRTALYLLGALAVLTLLATVVPQEPTVERTVAAWRAGTAGPGRPAARLIDAVGGFDVYGSPAFLAVLALLLVSLTACLLPRYRAWWRLLRRSRPPAGRHLADQDEHTEFATAASPAQVHAAARRVLRRRRWRLRPPEAGGDGPVAAEKGLLLREGGSLLFHTSFYVLLVAVVLGQLLSFRGQIGLVEGHGFADTPVSYWTSEPGRWWDDGDHHGFVLTLDRFDLDWYREPPLAGQATHFLSEVSVVTPDGTRRTDTVGGNDPLVIEHMKIHQLDWGYAPRVVVEIDGMATHDAFVTASAAEGGFHTGAVKVPAAEPDLGFELYLWPAAPAGPDGTPQPTGAPWVQDPYLVLQGYRGDLRIDGEQKVTTLDTTALTEAGSVALRRGQTAVLDDGVRISFPELRRWVGFQVSSRPTVPGLLSGAVLLLAGLVTSLYAFRRRLWVRAVREHGPGVTRVSVAGRAFQRPEAFSGEHRRIVAELRTELARVTPAPDAVPAPAPGTVSAEVRR